MPLRECAKKDGSFTAVSLSPDLCKTPPNDVPIPYQITASLDEALSVSPDFKYNGKPVVLADESKIGAVTGDEAGSSGGVISGTHQGEVKFPEGARSFKVNSLLTVRDKDKVTMNKGNVEGRVQGMAGASPAGGVAPKGRAKQAANPPRRKPRPPPGPEPQATQPGPTWVFWMSRSIDPEENPASLSIFQHSQLVFANNSGSYLLQSGPDKGLNIASITEGPSDCERTVAVAVLPPRVTRAEVAALVDAWNNQGNKYFPATNNCNTIASWIWAQLGFSPVNLGLVFPH